MSAGIERRRLAAIVFTDIVGYSALTQRDEALALQLLEAHRWLVRAALDAHGGLEVKTTGDGFLLEFASALAAVQCAVEIQRELAARNAAAPPERQVRVRIGIHLGDVVSRDGDVFGDGVNIASRIEPLAEPGGICISNAVYDQIENKVDHPLVQLTRPQLRNIQATVEVYCLLLNRDAGAASKRRSRQTADRPWSWPRALGIAGAIAAGLLIQRLAFLPTPHAVTSARSTLYPTAVEQESVAVLPFANTSADRGNEYLSDGITEELLHALARVPGLRVPARTLSFAFKGKNEDASRVGELLHVAHVLEGSVQRAGNRLRITAELLNAADGFQLWSETYDREMTNVFAIEDEITRAIVGRLKVTLGQPPGLPTTRQRPENIEAWELLLKGDASAARFTEAAKRQAAAYFKEALKKQPDYAPAYAGLAGTYLDLVFFGFEKPATERPLMAAAAAKALQLDDASGRAHEAKAWLKLYFDWDWAAAEREFKRAIELDPSNASPHWG
jgi:TolB-like protein/class 3 adenylate cyclase